MNKIFRPVNLPPDSPWIPAALGLGSVVALLATIGLAQFLSAVMLCVCILWLAQLSTQSDGAVRRLREEVAHIGAEASVAERAVLTRLCEDDDVTLLLYLGLASMADTELPACIQRNVLYRANLKARASVALSRGEILGIALDEEDREILTRFTKERLVDYGNGIKGPGSPVGEA